MGETLCFDIETNGLLSVEEPKIHCIATINIDTEEEKLYNPSEVYEGLKALYYADMIIGHNICGFDIPFIEMMYPRFHCNPWDTLVASRMLYPDRKGRAPHSIESWGSIWGLEKIENEDWSVYTDLMGTRCLVDTRIGLKIYRRFINRMSGHDWERAMNLEMAIVRRHVKQVVAGVDIDVPHAKATVARLDEELEFISSSLVSLIPMKCKQVGATVRKPFIKAGGFSAIVKRWFE